jgi:hypothetical protein
MQSMPKKLYAAYAHAGTGVRGGMQGSRDTRTYRHETPHPMTMAPMVLLIVGGTAPGFMIESESVGREW